MPVEASIEDIPELNIPDNALHALYYIAGYLVSNIAKTEKVCSICILSCGSKSPSNKDHAEYSKLKRFFPDKESLFFVNDTTFDFLRTWKTFLSSFLKNLSSELDFMIKF